MQKVTVEAQIPQQVYMDLYRQLCRTGDGRTVGEVVGTAIRHWLVAQGRTSNRGFQWKELFLPDGSELRLRYRGKYYYARVEGDRIMYEGESVTPREWTMMVTGTVRNAWRDIAIQRGPGECWTKAAMWRESFGKTPYRRFADRRRSARRITD